MQRGWLIVWILAVVIIIGAIILFLIPAPSANAPTNSTDSTQTSSDQTATTSPSTNSTGSSQSTTTSSGPQTGTVAQPANLSDIVVVDSPKINAAVVSPLTVSGKARGSFYFEASFPVKLLDANGKVLAQGSAKAQGDWMTQDFVPFTATLSFTKPAAGTVGTLVLMNDNPSGDPDKQLKLEVPVRF